MVLETLSHIGSTSSARSEAERGDPAIEVAVVLDETVVSVHHLSPSPARVTPQSWILLACAILGLAVFLAQAGIAITTTRDNRAAMKTWIEDGKASIDFRPRTLHPLTDLAAALGLSSALGLGIWSALRIGRERRRADFRIGDHTVVAFEGTQPVFTPAPGMTGDLRVSGELRPFQAGPLPRGARARVVSGPTSYLISTVSAPRAAAGVSGRVDRRALGYAAASLAGHALVIILFFLLPADASGYSSDELGSTRRRVSIRLMAQEDPRLKQGERGEKSIGGEPGPSGATGKPDAPSEQAKMKVKHVSDAESVARRETTPSVAAAREGGILGVLHARRDQLTALTAMADFTSGLDDDDIRGGYLGENFGDTRGWGTGPIGSGPYGGGPNPGTIGAGPLRTDFPGIGRVPPGHLPERRTHTTFNIGQPSIPEGIDKNMIRRYVRQKTEQIAHCYERELVVNPGLAGTATTAFTIDANGRVIEARARGFGVPAVEQCLEDVIRTIQFPKGGVVNVTSYPFTFHPVGGGQ